MRLTMVATVLMTTISAFGIHERKLHKGNFPCRLYTYSEEISDTVFEHTNGTPSSSIEGFPTLSTSGIYDIETEEQHAAFLKAHPDKLVVLKFYASYCRACKAMEPRFLNVKNDKQLNGLPIVWAECKASRLNKQFFKKLGVLALPTVHFYDGSNNGGLVENFQCGVNNIPLLKNKLATFLNTRVNPETLQLVEVAQPADGIRQLSSSGPRVEREVSIDNTFISEEDLDYLRNGLPFFTDLGQDDFLQLLKKAKLQSFNAGDIIIRQGEPGRKFYMMKSGLAEMSIKSRYADPISTPPSYLGAVVNQLKKYDYFGERALTTGEPYAASVRVLEKTRCFAFNVEDIPESCILSKQRRATQDVVDKLSQRYELPEDYYEPNFPASKKDENILELLVRFKQIRQAAKCFDYIMETDPDLGNVGEIARRSLLVSKLSKSQREEFKEVFNLADVNQDGKLTLLEMKKFMESARKETTDEVLLQMINKAKPLGDGATEYGITLNEFLGVMAEAEFYSLFIETFQVLDLENTGYVRAGDLDEVLHGVRGLISDDRKSIIDVEDKDVHIDYEQFSKMLLGAGL
mmetsp:Transcript_7917/g.11422  ORF Transcript_7917/g.11422 Transcript_7917/m.11422 type:complete len:575 (-) Transcript_7917:236-1960(-)